MSSPCSGRPEEGELRKLTPCGPLPMMVGEDRQDPKPDTQLVTSFSSNEWSSNGEVDRKDGRKYDGNKNTA